MALRVAAPKPSSASVIFLHGLGDTGRGWSFLPGECYERSTLQHVNFVLPSAPKRHYPAFGGYAPGWFGMHAMGVSIDEAVDDFDGIVSTVEYVKSLVEQEIKRGIAPHRIILGGFSQGGATTQSFATMYDDHALGGFVSLSGFLPHRKQLKAHISSKNLGRPLFLGHGTADPVIPVSESDVSAKALQEFGFTDVQQHKYRGLQHSVDPQELKDLLDFLEAAVPPE